MSSSGEESGGTENKASSAKKKTGVKRKSEADVASPTPSKKAKNEWTLGKMRRVSLSEFKGKLFVDIREMYTDSDGNERPGKKGISLAIDQWKQMIACADEINEAIAKKGV